MKPNRGSTVFMLGTALLCLWLRPVNTKSFGFVSPDKLSETPETGVLEDKFHIVGQLLLNCLVKFDNSNMSETPVVLSRQSPYRDFTKTSPADDMRSMIRQMEVELSRCQDIQATI